MRDAGPRTSDIGKSKNNISTPLGGGHNNGSSSLLVHMCVAAASGVDFSI